MGFAKELRAAEEARRREARARKKTQANRWQIKKAEKRIDWTEIDPGLMADLVIAVTNAGAAVMFGRTRDGGALVVAVFDGDDRARYYCNSVVEFEILTEQLTELARGSETSAGPPEGD